MIRALLASLLTAVWHAWRADDTATLISALHEVRDQTRQLLKTLDAE